MSKKMIFVSAVVALLTATFGSVFAADQTPEEKAIDARQGYMKLVGWSSGPIWGLLKGEMEYSDEKAKQIAAELGALAKYPVGQFFIKGTSKSEQPGKTRSLMKIWEDMAGYEKALNNWASAALALEAAAANGKDAFMAAAGKYGDTCGGCHKPYRAKEF